MGHAATLGIRIDDAFGRFGSPEQVRPYWRLFHQAIERVPDGVVITTWRPGDEHPTAVYCNRAFASLVGCLPSNSPKTPGGGENDAAARVLSHPAWDKSPLWKSLEESHRSDAVRSAEVAHQWADGSQLILELESTPLQGEVGLMGHRVAVFRDVTAQKNLENAVARNERLACIGLLGAAIAHEINNPTGSALVAAETALAMLDSPDEIKQVEACLENIVASMNRCGRIVRTLLRYSRQQPTERQACNINDVAEQSIELARPYGESHGAKLQLQLDARVPLAPMNPLEIELVLVNLIRNAVEAGGGDVVIAVRTSRTDHGVRVEVQDNGCGMNDDQLAHVFDPLYTTRRQAGGSGLGMSIALGIVQGHGGCLTARSRQGMGTTVTIDLPIAAEQS